MIGRAIVSIGFLIIMFCTVVVPTIIDIKNSRK